MLSRDDGRWLINTLDIVAGRANLSAVDMERLKQLSAENEKPLELLVICPRCKEQHIDEGRFAVEPHKNHSCQSCGLTFQVAAHHESIGVQFFSGYRNATYKLVHSDKPPVISLPSNPLDVPITVLHPGTEVRFDADKVGVLGYDCDKIFVVAEMRITSKGTEVCLEGDNPKMFYPLTHFLMVRR